MERKLLELIAQDADCLHDWTPEKSDGIHEMEIGYFTINFSASYHEKSFEPSSRDLPTENKWTMVVDVYECYDEEGEKIKLSPSSYATIERYVEMNLFRV